MSVIRRADARRTATPNAVMTTLASPTLGGSRTSVWKVDMEANQSGPLHGIDEQQVWTVLNGSASVFLATEPSKSSEPAEPADSPKSAATFEVTAGDTMVLPADAPRRISSGDTGFSALVVAAAQMRAYALDGAKPGAACATPDGDKLIPAWVV